MTKLVLLEQDISLLSSHESNRTNTAMKLCIILTVILNDSSENTFFWGLVYYLHSIKSTCSILYMYMKTLLDFGPKYCGLCLCHESPV